MTDTEIIKALGCWIKSFDGKAVDLTTLCGAFELINRQQATINRLKAENKNCGDKIFNQREQLKAANEKIKVLTSEIEELKEPLMINIDDYATEYDNKIKSEAVKEFAERLKEKQEFHIDECDRFVGFVAVSRIDNLLKEMGCE